MRSLITREAVQGALVMLVTFLGTAASLGLLEPPWDKWALAALAGLGAVGIHQGAGVVRARRQEQSDPSSQ